MSYLFRFIYLDIKHYRRYYHFEFRKKKIVNLTVEKRFFSKLDKKKKIFYYIVINARLKMYVTFILTSPKISGKRVFFQLIFQRNFEYDII